VTHTMIRPSPRVRSLARAALLLAAATGLAMGCAQPPPPKIPVRYATKPKKDVPAYLKDSVLELTDVLDTTPFIVSGYGLVVNLPNTGGGPYPTAVRTYMLNEMYKHGFGRPTMPGFEGYRPESLLDRRSTAIAEVVGLIPPGTRKDQTFDIVLQALPDSDTTSLVRGTLYRTDLKFLGTNPTNPAGAVNVFAQAYGPVFVNPGYANSDDASRRAGGGGGRGLSLRAGLIMDGGISNVDRPIRLQLRAPSRATARLIQARVDERFQDVADLPRQDRLDAYGAAQAVDEGIVNLYVPKAYNGDWQHFVGIVTHLFRNGSAEFAAKKAKELADEAVKPNAPLLDISYCWEGLGKPALPFVAPLMAHADQDVAFAATRAAAYLGEPAAAPALLAIARTPGHPFAVPAVQVLGNLRSTPGTNRLLRELLNGDQAMVRIEAYKVLARNKDVNAVYTTRVGEKFALDIVDSDGPPLIYATRRGVPRVAIIGPRVRLDMPMTFTAMGGSFSISSDEREKFVHLFTREAEDGKSLAVLSNPDAGEIVARLGGVGPAQQERKFNFSYGDVIGVLQGLADRRLLLATDKAGRKVAAAFVLQEAPGVEDTLNSAPAIPAAGRPQADARPSKDAKGPSASAGE